MWSVMSYKLSNENEMNGVLDHDFAPYCTYWGQPGLMRWILIWNMPLVQDWSLDLLTCSPARYHCTKDAPHTIDAFDKHVVIEKQILSHIYWRRKHQEWSIGGYRKGDQFTHYTFSENCWKQMRGKLDVCRDTYLRVLRNTNQKVTRTRYCIGYIDLHGNSSILDKYKYMYKSYWGVF